MMNDNLLTSRVGEWSLKIFGANHGTAVDGQFILFFVFVFELLNSQKCNIFVSNERGE